MLFGLYIPSWEGAFRALSLQAFIVGGLAIALFLYARQRHPSWRVAMALVAGFVIGLVTGLQFARTGAIAFFELWDSAIAASCGLVIGWLVLEIVARAWQSAVKPSTK